MKEIFLLNHLKIFPSFVHRVKGSDLASIYVKIYFNETDWGKTLGSSVCGLVESNCSQRMETQL